MGKKLVVLCLYGAFYVLLFPNAFLPLPGGPKFIIGALGFPDGILFLNCLKTLYQAFLSFGTFNMLPGEPTLSFQAWLMAPFSTRIRFSMGYNWYVVVILALNSFSLFILLSRFLKHAPSAFLVSLIFSFNSIVLYFVELGSLDRFFLFPVIFSLYYFLEVGDTGSWRDWVFLNIFLVASFMTYFHYLVFLIAVFMTIMLANARKIDKRRLSMIVASVVLISAFLFGLRGEISISLQHRLPMMPPMELFESVSLHGGEINLAGVLNPVVIAGCIVLLIAYPGTPSFGLWAVIIGGAVLSMGPYLRVNSDIVTMNGNPVPLPYYYLAKVLFPVRRFRVPIQLGFAACFGLAVLASKVLSNERLTPLRSGAAVILALLVFVQYNSPAMQTMLVRCQTSLTPGSLFIF